jgi:excisionase family DNA binding protein
MSELSPLLLSTGAAAARLGVGRTKLLELVRSGKLPCRMMGKRIRISADDLKAYSDSLPAGYVAGKAVRS